MEQPQESFMVQTHYEETFNSQPVRLDESEMPDQ